MDRPEVVARVAAEVDAACAALLAAMNSIAGPYGAQYRNSVAQLYFACFHITSALLAAKGITARSKDALQELLALHFVKPAALPADTTRRLAALMDRRHTVDYRTYVPVGAADLEEFRPWAVQFLSAALAPVERLVPEAAARLRQAITEFGRITVPPSSDFG